MVVGEATWFILKMALWFCVIGPSNVIPLQELEGQEHSVLALLAQCRALDK